MVGSGFGAGALARLRLAGLPDLFGPAKFVEGPLHRVGVRAVAVGTRVVTPKFAGRGGLEEESDVGVYSSDVLAGSSVVLPPPSVVGDCSFVDEDAGEVCCERGDDTFLDRPVCPGC